MKNKTLEEAAEQYCLINNIPIDQMIVKHNRSCEFETPVTMFIEGAKWQQEQIIDFLHSEIIERRDYSSSKMCEKVIEFIEQFKKK